MSLAAPNYEIEYAPFDNVGNSLPDCQRARPTQPIDTRNKYEIRKRGNWRPMTEQKNNMITKSMAWLYSSLSAVNWAAFESPNWWASDWPFSCLHWDKQWWNLWFNTATTWKRIMVRKTWMTLKKRCFLPPFLTCLTECEGWSLSACNSSLDKLSAEESNWRARMYNTNCSALRWASECAGLMAPSPNDVRCSID